MAGTNDFKAFATDANANVTSQEEWETLTALKKGFSSGKASSAQVSKALRQPSTMAAVLGQFIANAELDALDDGDVDGLVAKLATAITTNLGLGEGSALPVGVPVPWPSATPPTGWLKCNGAAFSAEEYPELAKAYPTNKLPDLRGEFIRGWDDGRGIDAGRVLLSIQAGMLEKHRHPVVANDGYDSKEEWELATIFRRAYTQGRGLDAAAAGGSLIPSPTLHSRGSIGNTGGSETRPRNIAFNYIVRAA